ncbi:MAG: hypothetical protein Q9220_005587 [cf. Caloplaca sp. 1 TL-2023]
MPTNFFDDPFPAISNSEFEQLNSDYPFPSWPSSGSQAINQPSNGTPRPSNSSGSSPSSDSSNQHRRHESSNSSRSAGIDSDPLMVDTVQNLQQKWVLPITKADPPKRSIERMSVDDDLDRHMNNLFDFDSAANSRGNSVSTETSASKSIAGLAIPQYQESPRRAEIPIQKRNRPNLSIPPRPPVSTPASFQYKAPWQQPTFQPQPFAYNGHLNNLPYIPMGDMANGPSSASNPGFVGPAHHSHPQRPFATPNVSFSGLPQHEQPQSTRLIIEPIPLKTRVETQIPITLILVSPPPGVTKVHLPARTMAKSKLKAKSPPEKSPEMLELDVMPVCASAMKKAGVYERALAIARDDEKSTQPQQHLQRSSSEGLPSDGTPKPSVEPMDGGPIKICDGCVVRERKRTNRRIEKEEESAEEVNWKRGEKERIVIFNEPEIVDWRSYGSSDRQEPANKRAKGGARGKKKAGSFEEVPTTNRSSSQFLPYRDQAKQVRLLMRITCYCRHQHEPEGFQVILTLKDHLGKCIAQEISSPILITDDHKTTSLQNENADAMFKNEHRPFGERCFSSVPQNTTAMVPQPMNFGQSHSTTDLLNYNRFQHHPALYRSATSMALQQPSQPPMPQSTGPSKPSKESSHRTSATLNPRNQSRQVSPSASAGPTPKRRRGSGAGLMNPHPFVDLSMTSMHAVNGPFAHTSRPSISPTPSSEASEGLSMDVTVTRQSDNRNPHFAQMNPYNLTAHATALHHSLAHLPEATISPVATPRVHRIIPNEGPKAGGIDVTILGECFCAGLDVLFADAIATRTTVINPQTIVCCIPPSLEARTVPIALRGHPPTEPQVTFRYVDRTENDLMRLALIVLHHRNTGVMDQNVSDIARSIIGPHQPPHTKQSPQGFQQQQNLSSSATDLETVILGVIDLIDQADLPIAPYYNARQQGGQTMLHLSASLGYHRVVAGLLARGANADLRDRNGMSAMHMACLHGHMRVVRKLLSAGGDPTLRSLRGDTPIDMARYHPDVHEFISSIERHTRTISVEATPHSYLSRSSSLTSINSTWVTQLSPHTPAEEVGMPLDLALAEAYRSQPVTPAQVWARSRRNSAADKQRFSHQQPKRDVAANTHPVTAAAAMAACWGDNLAGQFQYVQQSVQRTLPQIQFPQLPPLPTFEAYQEHPMVRRISSLVPRMNASTAPPAYDEIYPESPPQADSEIKKASVVRAISDTLMDDKCAAEFDRPKVTPRSMIKAMDGASTKEQREALRKAHADSFVDYRRGRMAL